MVISEDVSVQVNSLASTITIENLTPTSIIIHGTFPQMQKITMRFEEEPPILEKEQQQSFENPRRKILEKEQQQSSEKEQIQLQRQQMAAAGCLNLKI